ncbi:MAG TPA: energy transducer TonB [Kiritimatiellia bacterium]|nr:energy transducer TonB [Kiritimatiellia bacterium]HMP33801.1 energy transducer TonB [Kiritimatiellia bacterium]
MTEQSNNRVFKASLAAHAVVILLLVVWPMLNRCSKPKKPEEIIFVEFVAPGPAAPAAAPAPAPEPPKPEPPKPKPPEPPKPDPEPIKEPEPKPVKQEVKKPQEIKVNTNRIVRKDQPKPVEPAKPRINENQVRDLLSSALPTSSSASSAAATGSPSALGAYYGRIYPILYAAWNRPPGISGLTTTVSIRIAKNGAIMQRNLVSGSGNPGMDESVMQALRAVSTLPPLPDSVREPYIDVRIAFESSGLSM